MRSSPPRVIVQRLFVPTLGPTDWRRLLADAGRQWVRGKSAFESAVAWESARRSEDGLPATVRDLFATHDATNGAQLLLGLPEFQVDFAGGGHASQTDLWALLQTKAHFISASFEAKSGEELGKRVGDWLADAPPRSGKPARLRDIGQRLGFRDNEADQIRYQLLHRAATATKLAARFRAEYAVLVVHSFGGDQDKPSWADFVKFGDFMGASVGMNALASVTRHCECPLLIGWLADNPADEARLGDAV
jgi:Domain of unknown function (DUF6946)